MALNSPSTSKQSRAVAKLSALKMAAGLLPATNLYFGSPLVLIFTYHKTPLANAGMVMPWGMYKSPWLNLGENPNRNVLMVVSVNPRLCKYSNARAPAGSNKLFSQMATASRAAACHASVGGLYAW